MGISVIHNMRNHKICIDLVFGRYVRYFTSSYLCHLYDSERFWVDTTLLFHVMKLFS